MTINQALYSSATDQWATPQWLFDKLHNVMNFQLDVCALSTNAKCKRFFSPQDNGLIRRWDACWWMNPPYGAGVIDMWIGAANRAWLDEGGKVNGMALVPARTDTKWWHSAMRFTPCVCFLTGRLKFGDAKNSAPFPSALIAFTASDLLIEELRELDLRGHWMQQL